MTEEATTAAAPTWTPNQWADYWRYNIGVNIIPADTKNKTIYEKWSKWQDRPIIQEMHDRWKLENQFSNGIAVILGKVWHNEQKFGLYLNGIDADNLKAIEELCSWNGRTISLQDLAKWTLVEQHPDDTNKAHIYIYSKHKPFAKKSSDKTTIESTRKIESNDIPAIEVKGEGGHGTLFCCPSIHKNGYSYQILGTQEPVVADDFEQHIDTICRKYGISYLGNGNGNGKSSHPPMEELFKPDTKILEGHNRHEALLRVMESLISRNKDTLSLETIKSLTKGWNNDHCVPPLDNRDFEKQWKCALEFIAKNNGGGHDTAPTQNQEDNDKETIAQKMLGLAKDHCSELFPDQFGTPYAAIKIDEHTESLPLKSSRFRNWLCRLYYESEGNVANSETISNVLNILKAKAEFEGTAKNLSLRVAAVKEEQFTIFYDLTNKNWQVVKITPEGWSIEYGSIIFKRYSNQQPQMCPCKSSEYPSDIFDRFMKLINVKGEDNKLLLKCYIISLFYPEIPKPVLMLYGEQGSAKSTLQELIRMLVDPSSICTLTFPRDINELVQKISHNYIAYFDNVSNMHDWISDQLCRAVTGSGFSKRELYTDDNDIIYNFKRCIGFNGINLGATKADLLDRGIIIELERIPRESRRKLDLIWADFNSIKPQLLAFIFDILVKVLQVNSSGGIAGEIKELPRMADFAEIGEIVSRYMGYDNNQFLNAYYRNIDLQIEEAITANPVGNAIIKFMDDLELKARQGVASEDYNSNSCSILWKGTYTDLFTALEEAASELKINTHDKSWPKAANTLSRRIKEVKTNLREVGVIIIDSHTRPKNQGQDHTDTEDIVTIVTIVTRRKSCSNRW